MRKFIPTRPHFPQNASWMNMGRSILRFRIQTPSSLVSVAGEFLVLPLIHTRALSLTCVCSICPGLQLADASVWLAIAMILSVFKISPTLRFAGLIDSRLLLLCSGNVDQAMLAVVCCKGGR